MSKNTNVGTLTLSKKSVNGEQSTNVTTPTTTIEQEEKTMKNTTNATAMPTTTEATSATTMTAKEFKQASYDAYLAYVAFIEGAKTITETVAAMSALMSAYGFTLTVDNIANLLTVKMTAFGKDKGEQAKKVKSIATFRAFVKGGWADVAAAPVHSNAGKNPADAKTTEKAKKATKADLEAEIAALRAQLAAAAPATTANTEEKAA